MQGEVGKITKQEGVHMVKDKACHELKRGQHPAPSSLLPFLIMESKLPGSQVLPFQVVDTQTLVFFSLLYSQVPPKVRTGKLDIMNELVVMFL